MRYANQMRDIFNPGTDITVVATTAVVGKTFAAISGPRSQNMLSVTTAKPGAPTVGVFKYDADADDMVGIARGASRIVTVTADGYLYNMVRILAGTLVQAGRGVLAPDDVPAILAGRDRSLAGPTLPAKGLFLKQVDYPPEALSL